MRTKWMKRTIGTLAATATLAGAVWFAWPQPVPVDLAAVGKGPMEVTVDDEAKTRVRHIYTVSAPLAGKVLRTPREIGDQVTADETVVAVMQPTTPSFHDARTHEELQNALAAAESAVTLADAERRRIEAALTYSRSELQRAQALARNNGISRMALDKASFDVDTNEAALASAKAALDVRRSERASVAARLRNPSGSATNASDSACCIQIRAPVSGRVLRLIQESETVVPAGAPLIEIGNPLDLEVVADIISTDAVQVKVGSPVHIEGWGGPPLEGRVVRVAPSGFLKISALGIEEQRVRVTIDLVAPLEAWSSLGHDYRVTVRVVIWKGPDALTLPVGALFRNGDNWAVFAIRSGRARTAPVQIGHRNNRQAEVIAGLSEGDQVVLHPSDRVSDGKRVSQREGG
jgi:HlyD family secretion protein